MDLKPGNLVLVKADTFQRKRKIKDRWEDKSHKLVHQIATDVPSYWVMDQHGQSHILHCYRLLLIMSEASAFPYVWVSAKYGTDVPAPPQLSLLPGGVVVRLYHEKMVLWHPPSVRPGRFPCWWINRKLQLHPWMSAGACTEDRWRLQVMCSGHGCLQDHICLAEG